MARRYSTKRVSILLELSPLRKVQFGQTLVLKFQKVLILTKFTLFGADSELVFFRKTNIFSYFCLEFLIFTKNSQNEDNLNSTNRTIFDCNLDG